MRVVPVKSLFWCIAIWCGVDIINNQFLHLWVFVPAEIFEKVFWETALVLCVWFLKGRRVDA